MTVPPQHPQPGHPQQGHPQAQQPGQPQQQAQPSQQAQPQQQQHGQQHSHAQPGQAPVTPAGRQFAPPRDGVHAAPPEEALQLKIGRAHV